MSKQKILITGASSLLMQKLISKLDINEYEITGISRKPQTTTNIKWLIGDFSDSQFISEAVKNQHIIIHAAAVTHSFDNNEYFNINYKATKQLIDVATQKQVSKFIFISTRTAVPHSGGYGSSKMRAGDYLKFNFSDWLIFRPSEIFGGSKSEGIDSLINDIKNKSFMFYPNGVPSKMYPIHVNDAVDLMLKDFTKSKETIYINGNDGYSYPKFIKKVSSILNKKTLTIPIPRFVMYSIKLILETTGLKIGITPDQIPRLYCIKSRNKKSNKLNFNLEKYLKNLP